MVSEIISEASSYLNSGATYLPIYISSPQRTSAQTISRNTVVSYLDTHHAPHPSTRHTHPPHPPHHLHLQHDPQRTSFSFLNTHLVVPSVITEQFTDRTYSKYLQHIARTPLPNTYNTYLRYRIPETLPISNEKEKEIEIEKEKEREKEKSTCPDTDTAHVGIT